MEHHDPPVDAAAPIAMRRESVDCVHGADCGACSFLGVGYADQLHRKRDRLVAILGQSVTLDERQVLPTVPSPRIQGYRNRAKMTISTSADGRSSLGYFRRRSREVVDAPHCGVLIPELLETTRQLRRLLNSKLRFPFELRHVDLRCGSDPSRQHLTLVLKTKEPTRLPIEEIAEACPMVGGIGVNLNAGAGPQVIKGRIDPAAGEREVWVDSAGLALRVSPGSFFQVNLGVLPEIHALMSEFLGCGGLLVDLFAGVGTHGLALREGFRKVLCVEGVRSSVADAQATIRAARISNVEVLANPVRRVLRRLAAERPDAIILNPSAAGADQPTLAAVGSSSAHRLAYLSCDPETLARDLGVLTKRGFRLATVQAVDMMPQTRQVEALALLRR